MNDQDGKAEVKSGADLKKNAKCTKEAIDNCPVDAIFK
jgi:ferredoxin